MKTRHTTQNGALAALALVSLTVLTSCATPPTRSDTDPPRGRLYAGWVRFAGEFALYSDASAFNNSSTSHCVSGALPPDKQKAAAAQFSGKRVFVRARAVPWSLPDPQKLTMNNQGSPITNWCGGRQVLLATEMRLAEGAPEAP